MEGFDHILNWKLKAGSHLFPGPDGGTCINKAALVAAGFEYRPIASVDQMPSCFSRPICSLAMLLNDTARDDKRQLLLPFVTRLACADAEEVERKRKLYIQSHMPGGRMTTERSIEVLEGGLATGRQAEPLTPDIARARMEAVKDEAPIATEVKATIPTEVTIARPTMLPNRQWLASLARP